MLKKYIKKLIKRFGLLEYSKMLKDFYEISNFNFSIIYIIQKISVSLKTSWITLQIAFKKKIEDNIIIGVRNRWHDN